MGQSDDRNLNYYDVKKRISTDGIVAGLLKTQPLPRMCRIRQKFDSYKINDIEQAVKDKLQRPGTLDAVKPGQKIAITAGSRGVANIAKMIKVIVEEVKRAGAHPFIIPAMGSHGGAEASGQAEVLAGYGITEEKVGCPVRATMETVQIGTTESGMPVHVDRYAYEADGIILVNRVNPTPHFGVNMRADC